MKEKIVKGRVPLYGGHFVMKITDDMYTTCMINTPSFRNAHKNDTEFIDDLINGKIRGLFWLYENEKNKQKKRVYYLFFNTKSSVGDINHECVHWKNSVFDYHGIYNSTKYGEDEHEAYFVDTLVNFVFQKIYPKYKSLYIK